MSSQRLLGWFWVLALWVGSTGSWAGEAVDAGDLEEALWRQARAWVDQGELAKALALTRRGVARSPRDPRWHEARLLALDAAGMEPWARAEYGDQGDPVARVAWWRHRVLVRGEAVDLPDDEGIRWNLLRAEVALEQGRLSDAAPILQALPDAPKVRQLRAWLAWLSGDAEEARLNLERARGTRALSPELLLRLHEAPRLAAGGGAARRILRQELREWERGGSVWGWHRASEFHRASGDHRAAERMATLLASRNRAKSVAEVLDAIAGPPEAFSAWGAAPRGLRTSEDLDRIARRVVAGRREAVGWLRPSERAAVAQRVAARAGAPLSLPVSDACRDSGAADEAIRARDPIRARRLTEDQLLRCVGGLDLIPDEDPAGLDVGGRWSEVEGAWRAAGQRFAQLGHHGDAAIALAVGARLSGEVDAVRAARAAAVRAGATSRDALAGVPDLMRQLESAPWLSPPEAVRRARGQRTLVRTAAFLDPTPQRLMDRVTPARGCVPTLAYRCGLEQAVAALAQLRQEGGGEEALRHQVADPGARHAASHWLDGLLSTSMTRRARLRRSVAEVDGDVDLKDILSGVAGLRVGQPTPSFDVGGLSSESLRGKVVVLWFWGSWLPPSVSMISVLDGLAASWGEEGWPVRVFAVGVDPDSASWRRATHDVNPTTLALVHAPELRERLRVDRIPSIVVTDPSGRLRLHESGMAAAAPGRLEAVIRAWRHYGGD